MVSDWKRLRVIYRQPSLSRSCIWHGILHSPRALFLYLGGTNPLVCCMNITVSYLNFYNGGGNVSITPNDNCCILVRENKHILIYSILFYSNKKYMNNVMLASFQDAEPPEVLQTELKLGERLAPRQEIGCLARLVLLLPGNHFF